jgi:streptogramin lyase
LSNEIGRVEASGEMKFFRLPKFVKDPGEITAGPDGNLYFIADDKSATGMQKGRPASGLIGRVTVTGAIKVFRDPQRLLVWPQAITPGADGNVWFTVSNDRVGRITPSGEIKTFADPDVSNPSGITAGADGNIWFASVANQRLARITPAGDVTTLPAHVFHGGLAAASDGNVWYSDGTSLYRMTPTGVETKFAVSPSYEVGDIIRGPDGAVWFVNMATSLSRQGAGAIGRIETQPR